MKIITLEEIKTVLSNLDLMTAIEAGFVAYSAGRATVPPVGELLLDKGEVHIKYGYLKNDDYYVIKIASGFYDNPKIGLPTGNGLMLLFSQNTGEPVCLLLDEGYLTDIRTAIAGAICAKYLAPKQVSRIGILGTGVQAHLQLEYLQDVTDCRDVLVWGRGENQLARYQEDMETCGYKIQTTQSAPDILKTCNLIVTTTPATEPLLMALYLQPGTHITAMGSDSPHKQELDGAVLSTADIVVADSISQCLERGEIHQAIRNGQLERDKLVELGDVIDGKARGRETDDQVSVADLTGVAVQDIKIAMAVYEALV